MLNQEDKEFELVNEDLPQECKDPEISQEDFVLSKTNEGVHEQRFVTKPTTFLKDSLKRFAKNKSSVVAAYILGALVLLGLIVPLCTDSEARTPFNTSKGPEDTTSFMNLEPRLFSNAGGFWDGTVKKTHIPIDASSSNVEDWLPDPTYYKPSGIDRSTMVITDVEYTDKANKYGNDGYLQIGYYGQYAESADLTSTYFNDLKETVSGSTRVFKLDLSETVITLASFETVDANKISQYEGQEFDIPANTVLGRVGLDFSYTYLEEIDGVEATTEGRVTLVDPTVLQNVTNLNLNTVIETKTSRTQFENGCFILTVEAQEDTPANSNVVGLIKNLNFTLNDDASTLAKRYFLESNGTDIPGISFTNAMDMASRTSQMLEIFGTPKNTGYWTIPNLQQYMKSVYLGKSRYADFTYNTYEATLGVQYDEIPSSYLDDYVEKGYIEYDVHFTKTESGFEVDRFKLKILNKDKCPLVEEFTADDIFNVERTLGKISYKVNAKVYKYRVLGYDTMPAFLFGTDKTGRDMLKYTFEGLRNSLLLGIATFLICFLFGLVWGAVSGYFGGTVDLVMERITDILSGLPWIVAMTLIVLKTNSRSFGTFLFALCITGWIGTAARTRTQFYRFRGREYVLASRTLGASDARLIARHILPNSLGTIITGAVLMIPSVIFSEATISYLGLGFQDLASLGVILSNNQDELTSHPYQLIFPSVIIALLMISFNLFGNGLRDAINPSLKGEEE